jgi:hypothetical protein
VRIPELRRRELQRSRRLAQEHRNDPTPPCTLSISARERQRGVTSGGLDDPALAMDRPCEARGHIGADELGVAAEFRLLAEGRPGLRSALGG